MSNHLYERLLNVDVSSCTLLKNFSTFIKKIAYEISPKKLRRLSNWNFLSLLHSNN